MKRLFTILALCLALATPVYAQAATTGSKLAFDVTGVDLATAQTIVVKAYVDASALGIALTGLSCATVTAGITCQAQLPPLVAGAHTLAITGTLAGVETAKSNVVTFTLVVLQILNLRLLP